MIDDSLLQMSQASLEIAQNAIDMAKKASLFKEEAEEYIAKAKKEIDAELQKAKKKNAEAESNKHKADVILIEAERRLSETSPLELTTYEAKEILSLLKELDSGCNVYLLETKIKQAIDILEQKIPKQNVIGYSTRL